MFESVYSWILSCLQFALNTFVTILDSTGTGYFFLSGFFAITVFSVVIVPMLHRNISAGSDTAKKAIVVKAISGGL